MNDNRFQERFDELNRQVAALHGQQQFELALTIAAESRTFAEQHWGRRHTNHAKPLNNLAELQHELGKFLEAEPLYLEAIEICRRATGGQDLDLAYSLNVWLSCIGNTPTPSRFISRRWESGGRHWVSNIRTTAPA